jgi:thiamine-phosphate pyrophosphorylase
MGFQFQLYLITDDIGRAPRELSEIVEAAVSGGVTAVQFREKSASADQCRECIRLLGATCAEAGVPLMINASVAERAGVPNGVSGVHCGSATWRGFQPEPQGALHARSGEIILGYSAHAIDEAARAIREGAGFVTLSPIFETPSKSGVLAPRGTGFLREARAALPGVDIVALGGVNSGNAAEVIAAGAEGVAVIRAVMAAPDPLEAARGLRAAIALGLKLRTGF